LSMDAIEAILTRRSIRKYTGKPVSDSDIKTLMECAMAAPSADNQQPWHYVVVDDREVLNGIAGAHPHAQMCKDAALAVVVCGDAGITKFPDYWPQDCAAATQNILVAARALGLGTCWCGVYPSQKHVPALRELLGIPEQVTPFSLIAVGHPAEQKPPGNRYDAARVHMNRW